MAAGRPKHMPCEGTIADVAMSRVMSGALEACNDDGCQQMPLLLLLLLLHRLHHAGLFDSDGSLHGGEGAVSSDMLWQTSSLCAWSCCCYVQVFQLQSAEPAPNAPGRLLCT
jgi:hypothetical protein